MRVCIVTVASYAHGIGGMQGHGLDLTRGLVRAGHEVEVIVPRHPEGVRETVHEGARWHFIPAPSRRPGTPMRHPDWLRLSAEAFARLHAERPFDVVHSESTSGLGLLRSGTHRSVPFAVKFHGNYLGLAKAAVRRAMASSRMDGRVDEAKLLVWITAQHLVPLDAVYRFRGCEAMVPSRQQLEDTRRSFLLERSRLHVVPNGVDVETFRPRPAEEMRAQLDLPGGPLLVAVGRLNREKGFDRALRALAQLEDSRVRLVIVGGGEQQESLERLSRDLGLAERVIFAGKQDPDHVPAYLAAADVFLFPTQRDEAAPLVLPQAMACGLPVVASSLGGITEVIDRSGENGVLVDPSDLRGLVGAVSELIADPARRRQMGAAARERIVAEYTIERMTHRTIAVYELACARRRAADSVHFGFRSIDAG